jgi:hypothetical protein
MRSRPYVLVIVVPVVAYLAVLLLIAAFVVKPSTLGWVGLGVASATTLLIAGLAVALFPRTGTRRSAPPAHGRDIPPARRRRRALRRRTTL